MGSEDWSLDSYHFRSLFEGSDWFKGQVRVRLKAEHALCQKKKRMMMDGVCVCVCAYGNNPIFQ